MLRVKRKAEKEMVRCDMADVYVCKVDAGDRVENQGGRTATKNVWEIRPKRNRIYYAQL